MLNGEQDRLFPYPTWKLASYKLATADGAMILPETPFSNFPFNIGSSSAKKALWLVRIEDDDTEHHDSNNINISDEL